MEWDDTMNSGDMTTDTSSCASSESEASDNAHAHNEDGSSYDFNLHQANSVMNNLASSTDKGMCMGFYIYIKSTVLPAYLVSARTEVKLTR